MYPAFKTRTSHVPMVSAIFLTSSSLVTSVTKVETFALLDISDLVSSSVDAVRPRRTIWLAPAVAKALAVLRPIPLP